MSTDTDWEAAKERLPVGQQVDATVAATRRFGLFLTFDEVPNATGFVDALSYRPQGVSLSPEELPEAGSRIRGLVVEHSEHNKQIRVRVGPPV